MFNTVCRFLAFSQTLSDAFDILQKVDKINKSYMIGSRYAEVIFYFIHMISKCTEAKIENEYRLIIHISADF
jgi:hypothetical protein